MKKNTTLGLMIDSVSNGDLDDIIKFFQDQYIVDDIIVFSKDPLLCEINHNYGVLSLYYLKFYKGTIVFFTLEDYMQYKEYSLSKNIYLYMHNINDIDNIENIDRNMIKNIQIITPNQESNKIELFNIKSLI